MGIQAVDEVSIVLLEHSGANVPSLHDELVWNVMLVENEVEHIDVVSRRTTLGVDELERAEVPVADND